MIENSGVERLIVELNEFIHSRFFGKYPALVERTDDPDSRGRIKVRLYEIFGDNESPWVLPSFPFAGKDHGLIVLPEQGDGVWIEFAGGNRDSPIWTGSWLANGEMPTGVGQKTKSLVTSAGHRIIADDENDELKLVHSKGAEISLTSDSITLKIKSAQIVLSDSGVDINNGALAVK